MYLLERADRSSIFQGEQIDPDDSVLASRVFLFCVSERIETVRDSHSREPSGLERPNNLCLQQSTGDSTGPEIDVLARVIR